MDTRVRLYIKYKRDHFDVTLGTRHPSSKQSLARLENISGGFRRSNSTESADQATAMSSPYDEKSRNLRVRRCRNSHVTMHLLLLRICILLCMYVASGNLRVVQQCCLAGVPGTTDSACCMSCRVGALSCHREKIEKSTAPDRKNHFRILYRIRRYYLWCVLPVWKAGRDKVKVFGAWLDADVAGRKAGQGNRAAGLIARADRGESLTDQEKAEVNGDRVCTLVPHY